MYEENPGEIDSVSILVRFIARFELSGVDCTSSEVAVNGRVTRIKIYQLINGEGTIKATGDGKICSIGKLKTNKDKAFHC